MKIINESMWDTRSLRKLVTAVVNRFDKLEGRKPEWRKSAEITFMNSRGAHYTGTGDLNGRKIVVRLPRREVRTDMLAALLEHQYSHNRGYTHKQMPRNFDRNVAQFAWALEKRFKLNPRKIKELPRVGKRGQRKADPAHKAEVQMRRISRKVDRLLGQIMALKTAKIKLERKVEKARKPVRAKAAALPKTPRPKKTKVSSGRGPGRPRKVK